MEEIAPWDEDYSATQETAPWEDSYESPTESAIAPPENYPEDLPAPSSNMFAQMNDDEAKSVYDAYARHPKSQIDEEGNVTYNGVPVPKSEGNTGFVEAVTENVADFVTGLPGALTMGFETPGARQERAMADIKAKKEGKVEEPGVIHEFAKGAAGGALINAPKNTAELVVAASTYSPIYLAYEYLTGQDTSQAFGDAAVGLVDEALPEFNPEGGAQGAGSVTGEIGAGILVGNKVLAAAKLAGAGEAAITSLAEKLPRWMNYTAKLTTNAAASAGGTAATVNSDADTLVLGENAIIPILNGIDTKDAEGAEAVVKKRLNIFMDAMILGAPVELMADGGKAVMTIANDSLIKPIRAAFLDPSGKLKEKVAFENFVMKLREGIDPKNPGSEVADEYVTNVIAILKNDEEAVLTFPSILKQGPEKIETDVASAVKRGLQGDESEAAANTKTFFDKKRKEVMDAPGVQQTTVAAERPLRAAERMMDEGYEKFGGNQGVSKAGATVQESGEREVAQSAAEAENAAFELDKSGRRYGQILAEDGGLGDRLLSSANSSGSDFSVDSNRILKDTLGAVRGGNETISKIERTKWKGIREGLPVDEVSLNNSLIDAAPYLDSSTKKALREAGVDLDAAVSDEFIEDAPVADFAKLQNTLRKPLGNAIQRAKKDGQGYEELTALYKNIAEDQPEWLGKAKVKGGKAAVKELNEAIRFTKEEAGPTAKSGIPQKIRTVDRDKNMNRVSADQINLEELERSMTKSVPREMEHLAETLDRPEYGKKAGLIVDYALAKVADDMSATLRTEGVTAIKPKDIIKSLQKFRPALNANPERFKKELARLDSFEEALIANANNAKKLEEIVKEYTAKAAETRKQVHEVALKEFFEKEGSRKPDAYQSFKEMFLNKQITSKDQPGRLDDMIARMDPQAREGAVAAWLKVLKDETFTPDGNLSTAKVKAALDENSNLFLVGQKLVGDEAETVSIIRQLLDPALDFQLAKKAPSIKSAESEVSAAAAKRAATRLVLATKGPLTKFGGRVSSLVGTLLDKLKPDDTNLKIADAIMADRKEFLRMYEAFAKDQKATKETYRKLFNWLIRASVYNEAETFDKWYGAVRELNTEADTEENFGSDK